ncbi:MAG TPA: MgtC/SapB family protein [Gemmatimonadaceae bacterium]|nr:MgtC/SapB family protein [Gemmatimonadaceae bacterium]
MLSDADLIILARAALAAALGFVVGWERQVTGAAIKARTIGLAALTAAALPALGREIFATGADRIVQGIVTGIGFLGAGVIIHGAGGEVRGLTTAACLWAMTAIGVAIGSGHELLGSLLAALVYLVVAWGEWPVVAELRRWLTPRPATDTAGRDAGDDSTGFIRDPTAAGHEAAGVREHSRSARRDVRQRGILGRKRRSALPNAPPFLSDRSDHQ